MSSNTKNGWRSFEYPETGYVGMNYIPIKMRLIIEPNPHRGWTSDMINRRIREMIQSGEIDPNDLKIKHTTKMSDKIDYLKRKLEEIENGNKM
tara:strand:+ start:822 stop:1100 length:279 start_codon:yes stop_codon:yes gene_type:complete